MFERITDRGRDVIVTAQREARQLRHDFIGTEHLLLGIADQPAGIATEALAQAGVTVERLRADLVAMCGTGAPSTLLLPRRGGRAEDARHRL